MYIRAHGDYAFVNNMAFLKLIFISHANLLGQKVKIVILLGWLVKAAVLQMLKS